MNKIYLIGNAHIDPVWLWRWQEGFAEIKATFKSAVDRLDEYDDFVFTSACASYYEWVEQNSPELFNDIKKHVKSGRWDITGGWWIQPDCNIPSGESFARHGLYSQRYFLSRFGKISKVGYNVDSFGHNGMLPQILKLSGMDYYVFMRPGDGEKDLPAHAFNWESPDGSQVITFRIPNGYNNDLNESRILERLQTVDKMMSQEDTSMMFFYGVGNHGGGPSRAIIELIRKLQAENTHNMKFARADEIFENILPYKDNLPVVNEDLQYHANGCYSTTAAIKALNRKSENRITSAEKFSFAATSLFGLEYKKDEFQKAWQDVLFNQFHDIMGGCSIKSAYDDALDVYGEALKISGDNLNAALQKISWNIDTMNCNEFPLITNLEETLVDMKKRGFPIVVFNPNAWEVTMPVVISASQYIEDCNGQPIAIQKVRAEKTDQHRKWATMFNADLPPLGYSVFWAYREKESNEFTLEKMLSATDSTLENEWNKLTFDASTGWITSIFDKKNGLEILTYPASPIVLDDSETDTWAHGVTSFRKDIGQFVDSKITLLENGPLRCTLRVVSKFGSSTLQQDFSLYRDIPDIIVNVKINWQESRKILKLAFPVNINDTTAVYEIPYGCIEKKTDGVEEAGQQWFAVTGTAVSGKTMGLAIANDSKYSYDILGSEMRMTVLRSTFYADHFGEHDEFMEPMDMGIHYMKYSLIPFTGSYKEAGLARKALELNNQAIIIPETFHKGTLPLNMSFLSVGSKNITVHALKMSEDGSDAVLRCVETSGLKTTTNINLSLLNCSFTADFKPYEIKTFLISEDNITQTNLLEFPTSEVNIND